MDVDAIASALLTGVLATAWEGQSCAVAASRTTSTTADAIATAWSPPSIR
jgi:hypothetical protein